MLRLDVLAHDAIILSMENETAEIIENSEVTETRGNNKIANPAAVALAKLRSASLSPERRKEIARQAAGARWKDHEKAAKPVKEKAEKTPEREIAQ